MKTFNIFFLFSLLSFIFSGAICSDTIYTNDGKELKGIVVEDYKDRLIFSTPDGEVTLMKSNIKELYLDSEEDNLLKLAEQALERKDYMKSFAYYDKAYKLNPDSKRAKDGVVFLQGFLFRKEQAEKEDAVRRMEELENRGRATIEAEKSDEEKTKATLEKLKNALGISLKAEKDFPVVESVEVQSPAAEAGVKKGDSLVAIWGKLTGYMSLQEVMNILLEKPSLEIKCLLERIVNIPLSENKTLLTGTKELIGASLSMQFDGLTVLEVNDEASGLQQGDLITAIDGKTTRYMPLKNFVNTVKRSKNKDVSLTIRREVIIWRKTGG